MCIDNYYLLHSESIVNISDTWCYGFTVMTKNILKISFHFIITPLMLFAPLSFLTYSCPLLLLSEVSDYPKFCWNTDKEGNKWMTSTNYLFYLYSLSRTIECKTIKNHMYHISWLGKTAESLFIFLFLFFNYTGKCMGKCHVTSVTQS